MHKQNIASNRIFLLRPFGNHLTFHLTIQLLLCRLELRPTLSNVPLLRVCMYYPKLQLCVFKHLTKSVLIAPLPITSSNDQCVFFKILEIDSPWTYLGIMSQIGHLHSMLQVQTVSMAISNFLPRPTRYAFTSPVSHSTNTQGSWICTTFPVSLAYKETYVG